ncbi:MAG TPA: class I adenylate-forming enzyme family protein, partial [Mycobacterium sp.]
MSGGGLDTVGSPAFTDEDAARFRAAGWWSDFTLSDAVRRNGERSPDRAAYIDDPDAALTWREFDSSATLLAGQLAGCGIARGDRVAVWHGDSTAIHVLFVAIERCGAVVVGLGARAGTREIAAILRNAEPKILISEPNLRDAAAQAVSMADLPLPVLIVDRDTALLDVVVEPKPVGSTAQLGADDVFLINSTSGTTGLPKCVVHTQNR